jgi:hypothetical protein
MLLNVAFLHLHGAPELGEWPPKARLRSPSGRSPRTPAAMADLCTSVAIYLSLSRCGNASVLFGNPGEEGAMADPAEAHPGFGERDRACLRPRAAADFDLAPAGLAVDPQDGALGKDFDPAARIFALTGAAVEPDDFGAAQGPGKTDCQDGAVAQAAQILVERRQRGKEVVGKDRLLLNWRPAVAAPK